MIPPMHGQTTIPIRNELPDYPDSFRGKRLLGVDAYLFGHYWCGDRVEVYERREVLEASDEGAAVDVRYRKQAEIPVADLEADGPSADRPVGGLPEYVTNVGAYLDRHLDEDPVYADDATEWEWVSSYARDLVASRGRGRREPRTRARRPAVNRPADRHRR